MTRPKRPLPSLRFVVLQGYKELYRFIETCDKLDSAKMAAFVS